MIMINATTAGGASKQNKSGRHPDDLDDLDDQNASLPMRRRNVERRIKRREVNRQRRWTKLRTISILAGRLVVYQRMIDAGINPATVAAVPAPGPSGIGASLAPPPALASARHLIAQLGEGGSPASPSDNHSAKSRGKRLVHSVSMESLEGRAARGEPSYLYQGGKYHSWGTLTGDLVRENLAGTSADSLLLNRFMARSQSGGLLLDDAENRPPHLRGLANSALTGDDAMRPDGGVEMRLLSPRGVAASQGAGQSHGSLTGSSGRTLNDAAGDSRSPVASGLWRPESMGNGMMGAKNRSKLSLYDPDAAPAMHTDGGEGGGMPPAAIPHNKSFLSLSAPPPAGASPGSSDVSADRTSGLMTERAEVQRRYRDLNLISMAVGRHGALLHTKPTIHMRLRHVGSGIQRMCAEVLEDEPLRRRRIREAKRRLEHFMNMPDTIPACLVSTFFFLLILVSSIAFCLETVEEWKHGTRERVLTVVEYVSIAVFTLEYLLRLLASQALWPFLKDPLNLVDLVAILPFYIDLIFASVGDLAVSRQLRLLRMARVFRIMKLGRRFTKLTLVVNAVVDSAQLLLMTLALLALLVVIFSSIMFYAERGDYNQQLQFYGHTNEHGEFVRTQFFSIPASFWWCIVTLLTVGYGDMIPVTTVGKLTASVAMVTGVAFLALPISVVGANFTQRWHTFGKEQKASLANLQRGAPTCKTLFARLDMHDEAVEEILSCARDIRSDMSVLLEYEKSFLRDVEGESVRLGRTHGGGSRNPADGGSSVPLSRTSSYNLTPAPPHTPNESNGEEARTHTPRAPTPRVQTPRANSPERARQIWESIPLCVTGDSNIVKCLQAARVKQASLGTLCTASELLRSDRFMQNLDTVYKKYHQLQTLVDEGENLNFDVEELAKLLLETKAMLKQSHVV